MWPFSTPPGDPTDLARAVAQLLQEGGACGAVAGAANRWAAAASAGGATREQVSMQLDLWAAAHSAQSRAAVVRIGVRLHPAARLRVH